MGYPSAIDTQMSKNPRVSVIIPTYNRARLIGRAIHSVLNQTYKDFEIIVVDDASTDNIEEVLKSFNDRRIQYIRHDENKGAAAARNTGIKIAKGDYIAFQDSDDEWLPEKLKKQIKVFRDAPLKVGVLYTDMWRISEDGKKEYWYSPRIMPKDGIIYEEALHYRVSNIGIQTTLVRKECFNITGLFDERLPAKIDFELLIRLSKYYYFYHVAEPLVNYFETKGDISRDYDAQVIALNLILEKYSKDIKKDRRLLAKYYSSIGYLLYANGKLGQGRSYFIKALKACPFSIKPYLRVSISFFGVRIYNIILKLYLEAKRWLLRV